MARSKVFPISRADAERAASDLYIDAVGPCPKCGQKAPLRYTRTGDCRACAREESMAALGSDPLDVLGYAAALDRGLPGYFLANEMCPRGPHLFYHSISARTVCLICQAEKRERLLRDHGPAKPVGPVGRPPNAATIDQRTSPPGMPRTVAVELGFQFYRSVKPCRYGHHAPRLMTGGCLQCCGKWSPPAPPRPEPVAPPRRVPQPGDWDYDDPDDVPGGPRALAVMPVFARRQPKAAPPPPAVPMPELVSRLTEEEMAEIIRLRDRRLEEERGDQELAGGGRA